MQHTPLHKAAANGSACCIESIIEARGDVNAQDKDGCTALHHAAAGGCELTVDVCSSDNVDDDVFVALLYFAALCCSRLKPQPNLFVQKPSCCLS